MALISALCLITSVEAVATPQSITFPSIPDKLTTDGPFSAGAVATSGLPVSFEVVSTGAIASVDGQTVTLSGTSGSVTIKATQPGDATFEPAEPVFVSFVVFDGAERFVELASGDFHCAGIRADGTLWTWGANDWGQLGDGSTSDRATPVQVGEATNWMSVACGEYHTVALRNDGTLWAWGRNQVGQLGDGTLTDQLTPEQIGSASDWSHVFCGDYHTAALRGDGTLWTWGYNYSGQLGDGTKTDRHSPVQVGSAQNWTVIACGTNHMAAIQDDGSLWAWGTNFTGQLGDGTTTERLTPTQIGSETDWTSVACGMLHTAALRGAGTFWTWGYNYYGQLGDGIPSTYRATPAQIGTADDWSSVACGENHTMATRDDASFWAWGRNQFGQLGVWSQRDQDEPELVSTATNWAVIVGGDFHSIALREDGTLWAWGHNDRGQLGNGTVLNQSGPVRVGISSNWSSVACGSSSSAGIRSDGSLWTWGSNTSSQLGDGTSINRDRPVRIGSANSWKNVSCEGSHMAAIREDGTLWGWGSNGVGQLGTGDLTSRSSPVVVGSGTNWASVSCGYGHTIAIRSDGTLWTWGGNSWGELGLGDTANRNSPTMVEGADNWIMADAGHWLTAGIRSDGTLWTWGNNDYGQLGIGGSSRRTSPAQVGSDGDWLSVSCGWTHAAALRTDGSLWTWGYNGGGQLGDGTKTNRDYPVQIGSDWDWVEAKADFGYTLAIRKDGSLWIWGSNPAGGTINQTSPQQIGTDTNWASIACGWFHAGAIRSDGSLWTLGESTRGQMGVGREGTPMRSWPESASQVTTFPELSDINPKEFIQLDATTTSGLPVLYSVQGSGFIEGSRFFPSGVGNATITAREYGNAAWSGADPVSQTITIAVELPAVTSVPASNVTTTSADSGGEVVGDGGGEITSRGIVFSTGTDPDIEHDLSAPSGSGLGNFTQTISDLDEGVTYFARAYATNSAGTAYGSQFHFTTASTTLFVDGLANYSRGILSGDRHIFHFNLSSPHKVSFTSNGGAELNSILYDGEGNQLSFSDLGADFSFDELLIAGDYSLHVFRETAGDSAQVFDLTVDARVEALARPDVAAGGSALRLAGSSVYSPVSQVADFTSLKLRPVTAFATVANQGLLPSELKVGSGRGSTHFKVVWTGQTGNLTAALTSGSFLTPTMDESSSPIALRAVISPNRKTLTVRNKKTRKSRVKRAVFLLPLRAVSISDPAANDSVGIRLQTK